jgi:hypothetical protein
MLDEHRREPLGVRHRRELLHDLARVVDAVVRKNILGEIDANGQNSDGLPLPRQLMRDRTPIVALRCRLPQQRWHRDGEVPFIR